MAHAGMSAQKTALDLDRLADLAGIEPSYRDYFGRLVVASDDAKRAVLRALGIACDSDGDIARAIALLEERPWRRVLEPVTTVTAGAPARIAITLPANVPGRTLSWRIVHEDGAEQDGTCAFDDLPAQAAHDVDGVVDERRVLELRATLPEGYHRFALLGFADAALIVAPARCYLPPAVERGAKVWGIAVQMYALRSHRNWSWEWPR